MTVGGVQMQIHNARRETEKAITAMLEVDVRQDGRRDALLANTVKWLTQALSGLEMARREVLDYEIEGGKK